MINQLAHLHWISVAVAFVAYFILGGLWFPVIFKKQYAKSLGKTVDTLNNSSPIFIIGPAICTLVVTIVSALLMHLLLIDTIGKGTEFALVIGLGYLVANTTNIAINPNIPNPMQYSLISGTFHMVGIFMVTFIIVAFK